MCMCVCVSRFDNSMRFSRIFLCTSSIFAAHCPSVNVCLCLFFECKSVCSCCCCCCRRRWCGCCGFIWTVQLDHNRQYFQVVVRRSLQVPSFVGKFHTSVEDCLVFGFALFPLPIVWFVLFHIGFGERVSVWFKPIDETTTKEKEHTLIRACTQPNPD